MKPWASRSLINFLGLILILNSSSIAQSSQTYTVDRLTDAKAESGGEGSGATGDLRYALTNAQSGDKVTFTVDATIDLSAPLPFLTQDITIEGPTAGSLTIRGNGNGSVLSVESGADIILSDLTISGGIGNGGGIFSRGTLTLNNVTVRDNKAGDPTNGGGTGAGIWNYVNATLTLNNSTVSGNSAFGNASYNPSRGGGIANYGTLILNNSTVSGNSVLEGSGGGVSNTLAASRLTLISSTISANSATGAVGIGAGIDNRGMLNSSNSIIGGNTPDDLHGTLISTGHNLIGNSAGGSGFRVDLGDLLDINPSLGPLQDNGGPAQTHALLEGSPAIDQGDEAACPPTDQRGYSRPADGDKNGSLVCDIGAFEAEGIPGTSTITPGPMDTLTPTETPVISTETPTAQVTAATASPDPTSTPSPSVPPCSGAGILVVCAALWIRLRLLFSA